MSALTDTSEEAIALPPRPQLRRKLLGPLVVGIGLILAVMLIATTMMRQAAYEREIAAKAALNNHLLLHETQGLVERMVGVAAALANNDVLRRHVQNGRRDEALALLDPLFHNLQRRDGITHLYVHNKDQTVFLRSHAPAHYGDAIQRTTLTKAATTGRRFHGLELGKYGLLTLRFIEPWFHDAELIGYLELGVEIQHIHQRLNALLDGHYYMMLDKQYLTHDGWERGQDSLGTETGNWTQFKNFVSASRCDDTTARLLGPLLEAWKAGDLNDTPIVTNKETGQALLVSFSPVHDTEQRPVGFSITLTDVTAERAVFTSATWLVGAAGGGIGLGLILLFHFLLKRIEDRLYLAEFQMAEAARTAQAANRAKTTFLAITSHELRTPLNAIIGFSELIKGELFGPLGHENYRDYIEDIHNAGTQLLHLINDILDISRLEVQQLEIAPEPVELWRLMNSCLSLVADSAKRRDVTVRVDFPASLPPVHADPQRLKQILLNLLTNAIKFNRPGGSVTIGAAVEGPTLRITLADTGIGMNPEEIPELMAPFTQSAPQLTRDHGGAGLGLPIANMLARRHGGFLHLNSTPGVGTTASLVLPLAPPANAPLEVRSSATSSATSSAAASSVSPPSPSSDGRRRQTQQGGAW